MDSITHAKTNSLNTTYRIKPISPFGYTDVLTNISVPFYQDNSFSKHNYLLNIHDKKLQIATKAFNLAKKETENLRSNLHFSYIAKKQLVAVYKRKKKKLAAIEQSAVKIQKHIRGYLTRKKYYDVFYN
jgi:IQ calmodulin-binding motif